jgi:hypothetical protein
MLLADKRDLQNQLKLSVLHIEEKELNLYTNNCNTVGTQAALLAGFAFAAIIEVRGDLFVEGNDDTWVKSLWFAVTAAAMMLEICAVVKAMQLSIWAPGLALRGPEGSMTISLVVMRTEYKKVHWLFYSGLFFFHASVALYTWGFDAAFTLSTRTCLVTCLFLSLSLVSRCAGAAPAECLRALLTAASIPPMQLLLQLNGRCDDCARHLWPLLARL